MKINMLDLFSGIGGFSQGLTQAGFTIGEHYHAEIDKHANAIYRYQFPDATLLGDVQSVHGRDLERVHAITFGSPCQDLSIAGRREGIEGQRSGLFQEAIRLIDECRPEFFIWENVKGAFSTNAGADFWAIIKAFANLGRYRFEWQLLNTSWFLPQNRERIYLVGRLASGCRGDVFPIPALDRWATEGQEQATTVRALTAGGNSGGLHSSMTLLQSYGRNAKQSIREKPNAKTANCLKARYSKDASDNMLKIRTKAHGYCQGGVSYICPTIDSSRFEQKHHVVQPVSTPERGKKSQNGRRFKGDGEPSFTLTAQDRHGVVLDERIRRLTEVECERLQGFGDNWTQYGNYDGTIKPVSKTQRYKALGNAVTVDVVEAVARQIIATSEIKSC